jgi:hypothetical protein
MGSANDGMERALVACAVADADTQSTLSPSRWIVRSGGALELLLLLQNDALTNDEVKKARRRCGE